MKERALVFATFTIILAGIVFVYAAYSEAQSQITLPINKGWNLIPYAAEQLDDSSTLQIKDAKYIYEYNLDKQKYELVYKNRDNWRIDETTPWKFHSSVWAYFEEEGIMNLDWGEYQKELFSLSNPNLLWNLKSGWNFIWIIPEMKGFSFNDIKGNCNVLKMCDYQRQNWDCITGEQIGTQSLADTDSNIGMGLIIKVSEDCALGSSDLNGGINPPGLPPSTENNTQFRKDIESYYYNEISVSSCEDEFEYSGFNLKEDCYQYIRCSAEKFSNLIPEEDLESLREDMSDNGGQQGYIHYLNNHNSFYDTFLTEIEICKD